MSAADLLPSSTLTEQDSARLLDWANGALDGKRHRIMSAAFWALSKLAEGTPGGRRFGRILDLAWRDYLQDQMATAQKGSAS